MENESDQFFSSQKKESGKSTVIDIMNLFVRSFYRIFFCSQLIDHLLRYKYTHSSICVGINNVIFLLNHFIEKK